MLAELDRTKRELQAQLQVTKGLQNDKVNLWSRVSLVEEEMQHTIETYRSVLQPYEESGASVVLQAEEQESCDQIDLSSMDCATGKSTARINLPIQTSQNRF